MFLKGRLLGYIAAVKDRIILSERKTCIFLVCTLETYLGDLFLSGKRNGITGKQLLNTSMIYKMTLRSI